MEDANQKRAIEFPQIGKSVACKVGHMKRNIRRFSHAGCTAYAGTRKIRSDDFAIALRQQIIAELSVAATQIQDTSVARDANMFGKLKRNVE